MAIIRAKQKESITAQKTKIKESNGILEGHVSVDLIAANVSGLKYGKQLLPSV